MRYLVSIALFILVLAVGGCGERKFDSSDPDSLEKMMSKMSLAEQMEFIKDSELVILALGGGTGQDKFGDPSYKLNGYTIKQIRDEAENVRAFIKDKNINFLRGKISEIEREGKSSIRLHRTKEGIFSLPKMGYIPKDYSLEYLKSMLLELSPSDQSITSKKNSEISTDTINQTSDSKKNNIQTNANTTENFSTEKISQSNGLLIVPKPASECDMDYEKILQRLGLVAEVISVHGPEDADFNGYGCPYRISPTPGAKVPVGSTVTFRSAWESS